VRATDPASIRRHVTWWMFAGERPQPVKPRAIELPQPLSASSDSAKGARPTYPPESTPYHQPSVQTRLVPNAGSFGSSADAKPRRRTETTKSMKRQRDSRSIDDGGRS
jgi:hypothetical protein